MKRNTQQQQQPSEWAAVDTIVANTSYHGTQKDTTATTNNTDAVPIPYLLSLDEITQALFLPYLSTHHHHHHHHSPQDEQQDTKTPRTVVYNNIHRFNLYYYAPFLHFFHDGLAPWLQSRSLFPFYDTFYYTNIRNNDSIERKEEIQQNISTKSACFKTTSTSSSSSCTSSLPSKKLPSKIFPSISMFQDYPHSTQDYYFNCSGSSFLVFVLSMAIISNQKPSKGVAEAFKPYTDVSSSEKIISSLWMTTIPFTNPTIQKFLSSWVQLQWQVPYIMRVVLFVSCRIPG